MDEQSVYEHMVARQIELQSQGERIARELRQLAEHQAAISGELDQLDAAMHLIDVYRTRLERPSREQQTLPVPLIGSIADASAQLMEQRGGVMDLGHLHDELTSAGKLRKTPYSRTTLWKTLNRKPEMFAKAGKGRWRLVGKVGGAADGEIETKTGT